MVCYHPLQADNLGIKPNGKLDIRVLRKERNIWPLPETRIQIPCGGCLGCRLEYSRQWAMRIMHEAQSYEMNCFISLTYHDEFLPSPANLVLKHFQDFMKRLRKRFGNGIRFFHCGEYGELEGRPHFHACIFNHDFVDKKFLKKTRTGHNLYRSPELEKLWTFGFSSVGSLTFESAAYVARYCMKKRKGKDAREYYLDNGFVCTETGEIVPRLPEYSTMSRRPGIGRSWFDSYASGVYSRGSVIVRGREVKPAKFYDNKLQEVDPGLFEIIKEERVELAKKFAHDCTPERLVVREKVKMASLSLYKRNSVE